MVPGWGTCGSAWDTGDPLVRRALVVAAEQDQPALAVLDPRGLYLRVSEAFATMTGRRADELLGRDAAAVSGELGAATVQASEALLADGVTADESSSRHLEARGRSPDGREVTWTATLTPTTSEEGPAVVVRLRERVVSSRARRRLSQPDDATQLNLLGRAAELLGSSLEPVRTLENLCDVLVPAIADHAVVDLHDGDVLRRVAIRNAPGTTVDQHLFRPVGVPAAYAPDHPARRAFELGEVFVASDPSAVALLLPSGRDTEFFRAIGATGVLILPLRTRASILGTVMLAAGASGRTYSDADVALVEEIGERAAAAVSNALRYAEQRSAAVALQRSLLPETLDPAEGLDVAWRYVPGTDGTEVGGDWADVVELPGGRVALVIGDVMGRGLRAAAVMGQLRTAVRALAIPDPPPSDLLTHLDTIVSGMGGDQIVTCAYAVYDPARGVLTIANAGHLPPLLLAGGSCVPLEEAAAVPLGVGGVEFTEREVPLPRGAVLALYTDGLVEPRGGDLGAAVDRLAVSVAGARGTLTERCTSILLDSAPRKAAGFTDDVALLLVEALVDPADVAERHALPAAAQSVAQARRATNQALADWGLDDEDLGGTAGLLVSELVTNAVRYATGGGVELVLRRGSDSLWLEVGDADTRAPRRRHATPEDEGGRGLALVQALSAAWGTRTTLRGKVVWVRLDLPRQRVREAQPVR